jgi:hypothetical protein
MDFDAPEVLGHGTEQSQQDEKRHVLESLSGTVRALRRLIAEYDRVKGERNDFERQIAGALGENETLRSQMNHVKGQRDRLSNALATLTAQMDAVGSRCVEAVKVARVQAYDHPSAAPAKRLPMAGGNQVQQLAEPSIPDAASASKAEQKVGRL